MQQAGLPCYTLVYVTDAHKTGHQPTYPSGAANVRKNSKKSVLTPNQWG